MRTLDDFAFVKDAGFVNVYDSINDTLSLYDKVPRRIYCEEYRNPLDCAIYAVYYLANIKDAVVPKGLSGDNIGRLKQIMPEEIFIKTGGWELLSNLNSTCAPYHHSSGWPPESEWNKDAEKCYKLMVEICHWLVSFKENISNYLAENGPINWKEILEKKKEAFKALPENNSVAHTFQSGFEDVFLSQLDKSEDYKKSLEKDLEFYYNKMYEASSAFVHGLSLLLEDIDLPDEISEDIVLVKKALSVFPMVGATAQVMLYDSVIHPILFAHDWSPERLKERPFTIIEKIPIEDIYKGLMCVNSYAVNIVLGTLSCSQSQIESLQSAFKNQNEESFLNSFKKLSCDTAALHTLASFMPFVFKRDYGLMFKSKETYDWIISSGTILADKINSYNGTGLFDPSIFDNLSEKERFEKSVSLLKVCNEMIIGGLQSSLIKFLHTDESPEWNTLFPFEKEYVLNLLKNPDVILIIENTSLLFTDEEKAELESDREKQPYESADKQSIKVQNEDEFCLPEDFFSSRYPRDARTPDKHFNLDYDIEKCGGTKFSLLIDTVASWGFISSSAKEKQLLAYILSGRCMPSGYNGEGLEWIDNGYGYELLYVIKYIIGNEKGKYGKARKLFHGPQWLGKGDFKDQADYADAGFRRALNEIYPEVCIIKGHVETVREPIRESGGFHIPDSPAKP